MNAQQYTVDGSRFFHFGYAQSFAKERARQLATCVFILDAKGNTLAYECPKASGAMRPVDGGK